MNVVETKHGQFIHIGEVFTSTWYDVINDAARTQGFML